MSARVLAPGLILAGLLSLPGCQTSAVAPPVARPDTVVTVDGSSVLRAAAPGLVFGANLGAWVLDSKLGASTRDLIRGLRPAAARFPGGNISNNFCWPLQKVSGNDHLVWQDWGWGVDVDEFLAFIKTVGCVPMFSLNPFDHTVGGSRHLAADEAADLAAKFVAEGFAGAYYEVGNENDGAWNPMLSVDDYAERFVRLAMAVKSVDPSARLLGPVVSRFDTDWIHGFVDRLAFLGAAGLVDGVCYHHYGGWISNHNADGIDLDDPQDYARDLAALRAWLDARGLARVKIAVTEINAAIWDTGCTRDQFTMKQGLWLADALGVSLVGADMANVWIHLHPGTDPHSLIDSEATPPAVTRNYWSVALPAQTLSSADPSAAVDVLGVTRELGDSVMTAYAVRKPDGSFGVLLVNKSGRDYSVGIDMPAAPRSVTGRRIGPAEYASAAAPAAAAASWSHRRVTAAVPATSIVGLEVR